MKGKIEARVARAKSRGLSPYPRTANKQKHVDKQGFFNTSKMYKEQHKEKS